MTLHPLSLLGLVVLLAAPASGITRSHLRRDQYREGDHRNEPMVPTGPTGATGPGNDIEQPVYKYTPAVVTTEAPVVDMSTFTKGVREPSVEAYAAKDVTEYLTRGTGAKIRLHPGDGGYKPQAVRVPPPPPRACACRTVRTRRCLLVPNSGPRGREILVTRPAPPAPAPSNAPPQHTRARAFSSLLRPAPSVRAECPLCTRLWYTESMHPPRIQFWRQDVSPLSPPAAPLASPARSKCLLVYCRRVSPVIVSCYLLFVSTCSCEAAFTSTPAPQYTPTFRLIEWTSPTPRSYFYTHTHTHTHMHTGCRRQSEL
jgi:hypothetical protein